MILLMLIAAIIDMWGHKRCALVQVIDILIYKGREELEVSQILSINYAFMTRPIEAYHQSFFRSIPDLGPCMVLQSVALQHKQRHHLIGQFIVAPEKLREQLHRNRDMSVFMEKFYTNQL
jgi:hypothetical protein